MYTIPLTTTPAGIAMATPTPDKVTKQVNSLYECSNTHQLKHFTMRASTTPSHLPSSKPLTADTSKDSEASCPNAHDATSQDPPSRQWATWTKFGRALAPRNHRLQPTQPFPRRHYLTCRLTTQCDVTLNMLCPCRQNPLLSAHEALEGSFSFDATPMVFT